MLINGHFFKPYLSFLILTCMVSEMWLMVANPLKWSKFGYTNQSD